MGLRGAVAAGAVALAVVAGARAQECNTTIAKTAEGVPDLSTLVSVVDNVARDETLAEEAKPFLDAIQDPAAEVTAFAPVNAAFEPLEGVEFNPAAGQLVVNEAGDTVTGPCNSANVSCPSTCAGP